LILFGYFVEYFLKTPKNVSKKKVVILRFSVEKVEEVVRLSFGVCSFLKSKKPRKRPKREGGAAGLHWTAPRVEFGGL
jgi:hypothetical protein